MTTEQTIAIPADIATLVAVAGCEVYAFRESDSSAEWFKFKFSWGMWSPPLTADESIKFLSKELVELDSQADALNLKRLHRLRQIKS